MRRSEWGRLAALLAGGLVGCNQAAVSPSLPDPLVLSKRPTLGKADKAELKLVARAEPPVPPPPAVALASEGLPPNLVTVSGPARKGPGSGRAVEAIPAARPGGAPPVTGTPASLRKQ